MPTSVGNPLSFTDPTGLQAAAAAAGGGSGLCFDFNKFASQVEENRSSSAADLAALAGAGVAGTVPKTPEELRGLGVPKSELNPYTSQMSRWSSRLGVRELRTFGRTAGGVEGWGQTRQADKEGWGQTRQADKRRRIWSATGY
jgi:hypothetical protein